MVAYQDAAGQAQRAAVWEVQFDYDPIKVPYRWPSYLSEVQTRERAYAELIVYCPSPAAIRKYQADLARQRSLQVTPHFLTPEMVPRTVSVQDARRRPGMAALSAFACRDLGQPGLIGQHFAALVCEMDLAENAQRGNAQVYCDMIYAGLPDEVSPAWEEFAMATSQFISKHMRSLVAESEAKAKAEDVLRVLAARRVDVPEETRAQVLACTDSAQLDDWLDRAATAEAISDVTGTQPRRGQRGLRWRWQRSGGSRRQV